MCSADNFEVFEKDLLENLEVNLIGVIKTIQAFIPLIRNGKAKKVLTISTGMADPDLINEYEVDFAAPYAISKGALNIAVAKYNALYKKEGILFLAVSPGYVATERNLGKFTEYLKCLSLQVRLLIYIRRGTGTRRCRQGRRACQQICRVRSAFHSSFDA
jgi:NAD(P)-dependent dehydrogenase (short-subunit alcohol dehydrogenase family)